jgi:lipopolysaccharide/colanic/teichoic acid biosynthesis glycosyltransferase
MKELGYDTQPTILTEEMHNRPHIRYSQVKRALDIFLALNFLLIAGPVMLLIALAIELESPGPVFYRQKRIGKNGRPFDMLKFRSMRVNSDKEQQCRIHREHMERLIREDTKPRDLGVNSLKLAIDPRITGLGRILRRYSLDELPQFINVLRGEMSVVGPRPPLLYEYELFSEHDRLRQEVLPGMTGLWQVTCRNQVCFSEMVEIDLEYIEKMSLRLDLWILFRTPMEMLFSKGAG